MTIERARAAKAAQSLDKQVRLNSGEVISRRDLMIRCHAQGGKIRVIHERRYAAEERLASEIERLARSVPFGNPNHPETVAFNAKRAELKAGLYSETTYVETAEGVLYALSKAEQEFFKGLT